MNYYYYWTRVNCEDEEEERERVLYGEMATGSEIKYLISD